MAKVYSGRDGVMQLAGTTLAKVVNFSLSANLETLETTTLSENIRSYTPGISGYSGSARCCITRTTPETSIPLTC